MTDKTAIEIAIIFLLLDIPVGVSSSLDLMAEERYLFGYWLMASYFILFPVVVYKLYRIKTRLSPNNKYILIYNNFSYIANGFKSVIRKLLCKLNLRNYYFV